jgi:hypothetical protein
MTTLTTALRAACILLSLPLLPQAALAQADATPLRTAHGVLELRGSASDDECEPDAVHPCAVLVLGGKVLRADAMIEITGILPSPSDPRLVGVAIHGGGNCCPPTDLLLDFTARRLVLVEGFGLRDAEQRGDGSVLLRRFEKKNELGDPLVGIHEYAPGSGRPKLVTRIAEYPAVEIGAKTHPHDILGDPDLRKPLVDAIGAGEFAMFREDMAVQDVVTLLAGRFLVGQGCRPHACPSASGIFVIDREEGTAIALHYDESRDQRRRVRAWGSLEKAGPAQKAVLQEWLRGNGSDWRNVVPAPRR